MALLKATIFLKRGALNCKTGFSELADFAINHWTSSGQPHNAKKEYIIS
jgi:hypothetical protein